MNFQPIVDNITYKVLSINIIPISADVSNTFWPKVYAKDLAEKYL